jgi:acyl dehydratase
MIRAEKTQKSQARKMTPNSTLTISSQPTLFPVSISSPTRSSRAFAAITGDDHPIHYGDAFASQRLFGKRVAQGLLLTSLAALGATAMARRIRDAMVAFAEQGCVSWRLCLLAIKLRRIHCRIDQNKVR